MSPAPAYVGMAEAAGIYPLRSVTIRVSPVPPAAAWEKKGDARGHPWNPAKGLRPLEPCLENKRNRRARRRFRRG